MQERMQEQAYLVIWGNGFTGLYDGDFTQLCNTPARSAIDDLVMHGIKRLEILTPDELDAKRGRKLPRATDVFAAMAAEAEA